MSQDLPTSPEDLMAHLDSIGVAYELHHHEAVFTVNESSKLDIEIPGAHCRNLFLRDKKKTMFLVVARNETKIDMKKLQPLLDCGRLSFGSADRLWDYLGVQPGSVCPFAVINDKDNHVTVILDQSMMEQDRVNYHPLLNTMTIGLSPADLIKFMDSCNQPYHIKDLSPAAPDE